MTRQVKGGALAAVIVIAFVISLATHSFAALATVVFAALTVAYVVGIAWMRTSPNRLRRKRHSLP